MLAYHRGVALEKDLAKNSQSGQTSTAFAVEREGALDWGGNGPRKVA